MRREKKEDCLFCKIASGEIPAQKVYSDDLICAFHDMNPIAPIHILIIPHAHYESLADTDVTDMALLGHILCKSADIAALQGLASDGYRLLTNVGEHGGQTIAHLHFHLIGGRKLIFSNQ